MKRVAKTVESNDVKNTYRNMFSDQIDIPINTCVYTEFKLLGKQDIQTATDGAQVPTINAGVPDTTTVDLNDITNNENARIRILNASTVIKARNNGNMPVRLEAYYFLCKDDTTATYDAKECINLDLGEKQVTAPLTDPRFNVIDCQHQLKRYWKLYKKQVFTVNPGDDLFFSLVRKQPRTWHVGGDFENIKGMSQQLVTRCLGVVSHDQTNTGEVGYGDGTIDYVVHKHIKFSAQVNHDFHEVLEGTGILGTQTEPTVNQPEVEHTVQDL